MRLLPAPNNCECIIAGSHANIGSRRSIDRGAKAPRTERKNVKLKLFALFVLTGLLAGCSTTSPDLLTFQDTISGEPTDLLTDNMLASPKPGDALVWLNASRTTRRDRQVLYYLEVHLESPAAWHEIEPGKSLVLIVDGEERAFSGQGSSHSRRTSHGRMIENAIFKANSGDLRQIANAKAVKVKIVGAKGTVERDFLPANFDKFKKFVAAYVDRN